MGGDGSGNDFVEVNVNDDNDDNDWEGNRLWCMWFGSCVGGATMGAALQFCVSIPQIYFRLK